MTNTSDNVFNIVNNITGFNTSAILNAYNNLLKTPEFKALIELIKYFGEIDNYSHQIILDNAYPASPDFDPYRNSDALSWRGDINDPNYYVQYTESALFNLSYQSPADGQLHRFSLERLLAHEISHVLQNSQAEFLLPSMSIIKEVNTTYFTDFIMSKYFGEVRRYAYGTGSHTNEGETVSRTLSLDAEIDGQANFLIMKKLLGVLDNFSFQPSWATKENLIQSIKELVNDADIEWLEQNLPTDVSGYISNDTTPYGDLLVGTNTFEYDDPSDANDQFNAGSGNDLIFSGSGDDEINAGNGIDLIYGGDGDDTIIASVGSDTVYGGDGFDVIDYSNVGNQYINYVNVTYADEISKTGIVIEVHWVEANGVNQVDYLYDVEKMVFNDDINHQIDIRFNYEIIEFQNALDFMVLKNSDHPVIYYEGNYSIEYYGASQTAFVSRDELGASFSYKSVDYSTLTYDLAISKTNDLVTVSDGTNSDLITDGWAFISGSGNDVISGTYTFVDGGAGNDIISLSGGSYSVSVNDIIYSGGHDIVSGFREIIFPSGLTLSDISASATNFQNEVYLSDGQGGQYLSEYDYDLVLTIGTLGSVTLANAGHRTLNSSGVQTGLTQNHDNLFSILEDDTFFLNYETIYQGSASTSSQKYGTNANDILTGEDLQGFEGDDTLTGTGVLLGGDGNDTITLTDEDSEAHGGNGNDILYADDIEDSILIGGIGNDTLTGYAGDDDLYGQEGNDTLYGGSGIDHIYGGNGEDTIYGEDGNDFIEGNNGADIINGGDGADNISGGNGNDQIVGGLGNDYIYGDDGDDDIQGNLGNDNLYGGYGNDIIVGNDGEDGLDGGAGSDNLSGGADDDTLYGGSGNDFLYGNQDDDDLYGESGADILYGGTGLDRLYGGSGNDTIYGNDDSEFDRIWGDEGNDTLYASSTDELHGGDGDDNLEGGNYQYGDNGDDTLLNGSYQYGGDDNDHLENGIYQDGGSGDDHLIAGINTTYMNGGLGTNIIDATLASSSVEISSSMGVIYGSSYDDDIYGGTSTVYGGFGHDIISGFEVYGEDGDDFIDGTYLYGGAGNDVLYTSYIETGNAGYGGDGNDTINGSSNSDNLFGEDGDDIIKANDGTDFADGGSGNDTIYGGDKDDELHGGDDNDIIYGDRVSDTYAPGFVGNDTLSGGAGDDILYGEAGNDIISGGTGNDTAYFGQGNDTYIYSGGYDEVYIDQPSYSYLDKIILAEGILAHHITVNQISGTDNLEILISSSAPNGAGSIIVHQDIFNYYELDSLELNDGTPLSLNPADYTALEGTSGDDTLNGTANDDRIYGYDGSDTIYGNDGNDIIDTGAGTYDVVYGGLGNDTITTGTGGGNIYAEAGDDTITVSGSHFVYAGAGNDTIIDAGAYDNLYDLSDGGDDTFYYKGGYDSVIMGVGTQTIILPEGITQADVRVSQAGGDDIYVSIPFALGGFMYVQQDIAAGKVLDVLKLADGTVISTDWQDYPQVMLGDEFDNTLTGGHEADSISGYDGNDTLTGNGGFDNIWGGLGDDVIYGDDGEDNLYGNDGADEIHGGDGIDYIVGGDGDDILYGGASNDILYGDAGNDILHAQADGASMHGGFGNDTYYGGTGYNSYYYTAGHDIIEPNTGYDTLILPAGVLAQHVSVESAGGDFIRVLIDAAAPNGAGSILIENDNASGDVLEALFLNDYTPLSLNPADYAPAGETYTGTTGSDNYTGTSGDDIVDAGAGNDTLDGGDGNDTISAGTGNDTVDGGAGNDTINGDDGQDVINGGDGNDIIDGGLHNDTITGGLGDDTYYASSGTDIYVINSGDGNDEIFNTGSGYDRLSTSANINSITFTREVATPDDVTIHIDGSTSLTVHDVLNQSGSYSYMYRIDGMGGTRYLYQATLQTNGTAGDDTINGATSTGIYQDLIYAGDGNDTINAGSSADIVYGEAGNDIIDSGSGSDTAYGGTGNDTITSGGGIDTFYGDDGDDILTGARYSYGGAGTDTITGSSYNDEIYGGAGDDVYYGTNGYDNYHIYAGDGRDTIYNSGTLANNIYTDVNLEDLDLTRQGVNGNDITLHIDNNTSFTMTEMLNQSSSYISRIYAANGNIYLSGLTLEVTGSSSADTFLPFTNSGFSYYRIYAGDGDDIITGGNQNDTIYGEGGNDTITTGNGNDTVYGGDGNDTITSTGGSDILYGDAGNDTLQGTYMHGGLGDDILIASAGSTNYYINTGEGHDTIQGEDTSGLNKIYVDVNLADVTLSRDLNSQDDVIVHLDNNTSICVEDLLNNGWTSYVIRYIQGADGQDEFTDFTLNTTGTSGNDVIEAINNGTVGLQYIDTGLGDDIIDMGLHRGEVHAGGGNDIINGSSYHDTLYGDAGNDILNGKDGIDHLYGGTGADTFVVEDLTYDLDTVYDFDLLEGDKVDLSYLFDDNNLDMTATDAFQNGYVTVEQSASDVLVRFDHNGASISGGSSGAIKLLNQDVADFDETAFIV